MPTELTGTLHFIDETRTYGEKFKKRAFILRVPNPKDEKWDDYIPMACVRDRVDMLDHYREGEEVTVSIDIKGRLKKGDYTTAYADIECWRMARGAQSHQRGSSVNNNRRSQPDERTSTGRRVERPAYDPNSEDDLNF